MADSTHNGHGTNGHSNGHVNGQTNGHAGHGHGGVRFEPTDIDPKSLYLFTSVLVAVVLLAVLSMWFLYRYLNAEVTTRQDRELSALVLEATKDVKPGMRLPNQNGKSGPMLEGIQGTTPSAPRSGIMGYTSLALDAKKGVDARLAEYGYHHDHPTLGHIPIDDAIKEVLKDKTYQVRDKMPGTPIGSVQHPYSFYPSDASSGRMSQGTTRETKP